MVGEREPVEFHAADIPHREQDHAGRVGMQGEPRDVEPQVLPTREIVAGWIGLGRRIVRDGLRLAGPRLESEEIAFGVADRAEHELQPPTVLGPELAAQRLRLLIDLVEDAAARAEPLDLGLDFSLRAVDEELLEDLRRLPLGGHRHALGRPGEMPLHRWADHEVAKPRVAADPVRDMLIERDRVAVLPQRLLDPIPVDAGEQAGLAVVVRVPEMGDAGEQRESAAIGLEMLEVAGGFVAEPRRLGKEKRRVHAQISPHEQQPVGRVAGRGTGRMAAGQHRLEGRKGDADGPSLQEQASRHRDTEVCAHGRGVHLLRKGRLSLIAWMRLRRP